MFNVRRTMKRVSESAMLSAAMAVAPFCAAQAPAAGAAPAAAPAAPASVAPASAAKASWTLMFYLDADNNLEKEMMINLEQMAAVGSSADVNLIALVARSPKGEEEKGGGYTNRELLNQKNWTTAQLFKVEKDKLTPIAWDGGTDLSDGDTLGNFLAAAMQGFPARHYGLIFGDHGMAWAGVAVDENMHEHSLGLKEIAEALKNSNAATAKLDLVGFDACLMANLEVAKALQPFAQYMVASEDIEPEEGWDYFWVLGKLKESPTMDGAALGDLIVKSYYDFYANSREQDLERKKELEKKAKAITLSLIDLSKLPAVEQAVAAMSLSTSALLKKGDVLKEWDRVAVARFKAEEYGRSSKPNEKSGESSEVYDLANVASNIEETALDQPNKAAASAVLDAIVKNKAVVEAIHGVGRPHANGLSIFFPPDQENLKAAHFGKIYRDTQFAQSNNWFQSFLPEYMDVRIEEEKRHPPKPVIDDLLEKGRGGGAGVAGGAGSAGGKFEITSRAHGDADDGVDAASFVVAQLDGDDRIIIGSIPVDLDVKDDLKGEWDGTWFSITDQTRELIAPITSFEELSDTNGEDLYWAEVPAQVRFKGSEKWLDVTLTFELEFEDEELVKGDFIYAVEYSDFGPREIEFDEGVDLRPVYTVIDADGAERLEPSPPEDVMRVDDVEDLKVGRSRLPAGDYQVGFVVQDLLGRNSERFVDVIQPEEDKP